MADYQDDRVGSTRAEQRARVVWFARRWGLAVAQSFGAKLVERRELTRLEVAHSLVSAYPGPWRRRLRVLRRQKKIRFSG